LGLGLGLGVGEHDLAQAAAEDLVRVRGRVRG